MYQISQSNTQHETSAFASVADASTAVASAAATTFPQKRRSKRGPTQTFTNNTNMIYFDRTSKRTKDYVIEQRKICTSPVRTDCLPKIEVNNH